MTLTLCDGIVERAFVDSWANIPSVLISLSRYAVGGGLSNKTKISGAYIPKPAHQKIFVKGLVIRNIDGFILLVQ